MSNDEFETWLSLVGRLLGLNERQRKLIGEELRDHLESRVADLLESGMDKKSAVMQAVEEFGDAAVLAKNLQSVSLENRKRWMMRFMTFATAGVFLFALLTMAMWPENARFGSPSRTVAQDQEDPFGDDAKTEGANPFGEDPITSQPPARQKRAPKISPSARTITNAGIREKLKQNHDLIYDQAPFEDVLAQLRDMRINTVIDPNLEGILDSDTEVSANLANIRLADGLRMMLKGVDATFVVQNGALIIISIDDENEPEYLTRQMIDVREVLDLIKMNERDRIGKPIAYSAGGGGFGGGGGGLGGGGQGGGGMFRISPQGLGGGGGSAASLDQIDVETKVDSEPKVLLTAEHLLIETITRVVNSDVWVMNGSGNCDLTCVGGVLIVISDDSTADELRDLITDLQFEMKNR